MVKLLRTLSLAALPGARPASAPDRGSADGTTAPVAAGSFDVCSAPMDRERFRELVAEALEDIPEPFLSRLENVEVVVEDEPPPALLREMGLDPRRDSLFGLYQGTPLGERGDTPNLTLPDRIVIYYRPLLHAFPTPRALRRQVRDTVIHEIAHYFGLDDEDIEREGY